MIAVDLDRMTTANSDNKHVVGLSRTEITASEPDEESLTHRTKAENMDAKPAREKPLDLPR